MSGSALGLSTTAWVSAGVSTLKSGLTEFSNQMYDNKGKLNTESWNSILGKTFSTAITSVGGEYIKEPGKQKLGKDKSQEVKTGGGPLYEFNKSHKDYYFTLKAGEKLTVSFAAKFTQNYVFGKDRDKYWSEGLLKDLGSSAGDNAMDLKNAALELKPKVESAYDWYTSTSFHKWTTKPVATGVSYYVNYAIVKPVTYVADAVNTYGIRYIDQYVVQPVIIPAAEYAWSGISTTGEVSYEVLKETPIIGPWVKLGVEKAQEEIPKLPGMARKEIDKFLTLPEIP
jgi:hypothetical protein